TVYQKIKNGIEISFDEAVALSLTDNKEALYELAAKITEEYAPKRFDMCSIINVKSGKCPEDCKWCAQSAHWKTTAEVYPFIESAESVHQAKYNEKQGINRFSLVASGRRLSKKDLDAAVETYKHIKSESNIRLCASLGLVTKEDLLKLKEAGVTTYHCNLEAAPSYFGDLCTTHSQDDKIRTLMAAHEVGMELCSGGIIGMGETMEQRIELAFKLKELPLFSIPINMLHPIPGTPLENEKPLTDEEVLTTVALFRLIHPTKYLRFSGGRALMSRELQRKAHRCGMNSAIVGDLLTTIGSTVDEDKEMFGIKD
ncbi:MAG: biotin synthase BioB, partial [Bacteroidales bacterium]